MSEADFERYMLPRPSGAEEPLTFQYDPNPGQADPPPAGVTAGWCVIWSGRPGPASVARAGVIHDGTGLGSIVISGDFEDCNVADDTEESP